MRDVARQLRAVAMATADGCAIPPMDGNAAAFMMYVINFGPCHSKNDDLTVLYLLFCAELALSDGRKDAARKHAKPRYTCGCGKVCHGNGGWSSHRKACVVARFFRPRSNGNG